MLSDGAAGHLIPDAGYLAAGIRHDRRDPPRVLLGRDGPVLVPHLLGDPHDVLPGAERLARECVPIWYG